VVAVTAPVSRRVPRRRAMPRATLERPHFRYLALRLAIVVMLAAAVPPALLVWLAPADFVRVFGTITLTIAVVGMTTAIALQTLVVLPLRALTRGRSTA
jgi:hypothetical protein